jgi:hypothetical protein
MPTTKLMPPLAPPVTRLSRDTPIGGVVGSPPQRLSPKNELKLKAYLDALSPQRKADLEKALAAPIDTNLGISLLAADAGIESVRGVSSFAVAESLRQLGWGARPGPDSDFSFRPDQIPSDEYVKQIEASRPPREPRMKS